MITFLASGLWHGASWNYVLWGGYHGLLLVITRSMQLKGFRVAKVLTMFALTCVGWLIFRETELSQLIADFKLSPMEATPLGRSTGLYLFVLVLLYSLPLWIHDVWAELKGPDLVEEIEQPRAVVRWDRAIAQAALCGVMVAAILVMRSQTALNFIYFAF
jgi:alginate O-acetyltransferase complex protein AlgI